MESKIHSGAVVFVKNLPKLTAFYEGVTRLEKVRDEEDYALLERDGYQLVVH